MRRDSDMRRLSEADLKDEAQRLRAHVRNGAKPNALVERAFALVREASRRELSQTHTLSQLIGGLAMHEGYVVEMPTGEGKTLTATLTSTLQAMSGAGVHVASPNDYLSSRDAAWMKPIYAALGLSTGIITTHMDDDSRRSAYGCDVTYGVASEFAFDYLRDNMKYSRESAVQRGHGFALIDEADAILIDEATMPLSLFGPLGDHSEFYKTIDAIVAGLQPNHYRIDDHRHVHLTDEGYGQIDAWLKQAELLKPDASLHVTQSITLLHHVIQAVRARTILQRDRDYVVKDDKVVIVDRYSGRMMEGRRYDDGLHQALEAKERCLIGEEARTLASITFQSFFRKYQKLAGMTGTAIDDADEYRQIYGMPLLSVPPERPSQRIDRCVYHLNRDAKLAAIVARIEEAHARGQPVLVGAPTISRSEAIASALKARGWRTSLAAGPRVFALLSAKHHEHEAQIVAQAGSSGAVTIATAMAGRGTDIRLGGLPISDENRQRVAAAGGLLVIGSEHHEFARLDRQLRGRAGRQGDAGQSEFHTSWEDELVNAANTPGRTMAARPMPLERAIAEAQRRNLSRTFNERSALMRFDDVIETQRMTLLAQRAIVRDTEDPLALADDLRQDTIDDLLQRFAPKGETPQLLRLDASVRAILTLAIDFSSMTDQMANTAHLRRLIKTAADNWMAGKVKAFGAERLAEVIRGLMLALLDQLWTEQTQRLEHLRRAVSDRGLNRQRTQAEYRSEAFSTFAHLMMEFRHEATAHAMRLGLRAEK